MFVRLTPCNLFAIFQISFFGLLFCQKTKTFVLEWFNFTCDTSQTQVVTVRHVRWVSFNIIQNINIRPMCVPGVWAGLVTLDKKWER